MKDYGELGCVVQGYRAVGCKLQAYESVGHSVPGCGAVLARLIQDYGMQTARIQG